MAGIVRKHRVPQLTYVDDLNYTRQRLQETYVKDSKGKMVFVRFINKVKDKFTTNVFDNRLDYIEDLDKLDIHPFKYGYTNIDGTSVFISRLPLRNDWRQGNRITQLNFFSHREHTPINRNNLLNNMWDLQDTVENKYYAFNTCLDMIEDGYQVRAINRDFAIDNKYSLFYRGFKVGKSNLDNGEVNLLPEFFWLQESVNELDNFKEIKKD